MTREEAIQIIRKNIPHLGIGAAEMTEALNELIPELRESEDENLKNKSGYYKAGKFWKASTLWNAVKGKSPQKVPNRYILQECTWNISSLQHFADEVKNVQEVNLDYPIILDMNGNILDGAHRVVKAYLEDKDIDIVYLGDDEWPEPDYDEEKAVKESEDERIRKELIEYLRGDLDDITTDDTDRWINWLEQQKESLHIPETCKENAGSFTDEDEDRTINGCLLAANAERRCKRASEELLEELGLADYTKFFYEQGVEKGKKEREKQKEQSLRDFIDDFPYSDQKEQKPVDDSDFKTKLAEYMTKNCTGYSYSISSESILEMAKEELIKRGELQKPAEWSEDIIRKAVKEVGLTQHQIDWFKTNVFPPKPAWSEEDEKMLKCCLIAINHYEKTCNIGDHLPTKFNIDGYLASVDKVKSWLKSIRPQPKQELSKEETKDLVHILKVLDDCYAYGKHDLSKTDHDNLTSTIKSLRPGWKPSEEHLSALLAIFNDPDNLGSQTCQLALTDLYEQLKKLM